MIWEEVERKGECCEQTAEVQLCSITKKNPNRENSTAGKGNVQGKAHVSCGTVIRFVSSRYQFVADLKNDRIGAWSKEYC